MSGSSPRITKPLHADKNHGLYTSKTRAPLAFDMFGKPILFNSTRAPNPDEKQPPETEKPKEDPSALLPKDKDGKPVKVSFEWHYILGLLSFKRVIFILSNIVNSYLMYCMAVITSYITM